MMAEEEVRRLAIEKFQKNADCRSRILGIPIAAEKYADWVVDELNKYRGNSREDMERLLLMI